MQIIIKIRFMYMRAVYIVASLSFKIIIYACAIIL